MVSAKRKELRLCKETNAGMKCDLNESMSEVERLSELYQDAVLKLKNKNKKINALQKRLKSYEEKSIPAIDGETDSNLPVEAGNEECNPESAIFKITDGAGPVEPLTTNIPDEESAMKEAIPCLICGVQLPSLVWHLKVSHGMTPDGYRSHFDLPGDFPLQVNVTTD